ncbi:MAG TPA: hypothetical protein PKI61_00565 [bacterium]|nr:hypothetical protein [bacterium]HPT29380.1 hypothetical protein [bacterium]
MNKVKRFIFPKELTDEIIDGEYANDKSIFETKNETRYAVWGDDRLLEITGDKDGLSAVEYDDGKKIDANFIFNAVLDPDNDNELEFISGKAFKKLLLSKGKSLN